MLLGQLQTKLLQCWINDSLG